MYLYLWILCVQIDQGNKLQANDKVFIVRKVKVLKPCNVLDHYTQNYYAFL